MTTCGATNLSMNMYRASNICMNMYGASNVSIKVYGAFNICKNICRASNSCRNILHPFMIYSWISTPGVRQKLRTGQTSTVDCVSDGSKPKNEGAGPSLIKQLVPYLIIEPFPFRNGLCRDHIPARLGWAN